MPSGAGFDSYFFRDATRFPSRGRCRLTAGQRNRSSRNHLARSRADARWFSWICECRCESGHLSSGCSSRAERVVGGDEVAGAIPVTQTNVDTTQPRCGPTKMLTLTSLMPVQVRPPFTSVRSSRSRLLASSRCTRRDVKSLLSPRTCGASPPFRGTGHELAKFVGRGSIPLGGTNGP